MEVLSLKDFRLGIAWTLIVIILTCTPLSAFPQVNYWASLELPSMTIFDKVAHIILFGFLVLFFCRAYRKIDIPPKIKLRYFTVIASLASILGFCIELIQHYFVPGRSFDMKDWMADNIGAIIGFFISKYYFI